MRFGLSRVTLGLGLLALLAVIAAPTLRYGIVPAQSKLPADTDTSRNYTGTFDVLLNPAALSGGSGPLLLTGVPAEIVKRVTVLKTAGDNAVVRDANVVRAAGSVVATTSEDFAVNRVSLAGTSPVGLDSAATQVSGQTVSWPVDTQPKDYTYWVQDIGAAVPARYTGTAVTDGERSYVFQTAVSPTPITDQAVLGKLPAALPKQTLAGLAAGLGLSATQTAGLGQLLPVLPDPVPLSYSYAGTTTFFVEPETGIVLSSERSETRTAAIAATATTPAVPLTPVWKLSFASTNASIAAAVSDARSAIDRKAMFGTTLPLALLGLGVALLALVGWLSRGRRRGTEPSVSTAPAVLVMDAPAHDQRTIVLPTSRKDTDELTRTTPDQ